MAVKSSMEVFGLGFSLTLPHITRNLDYGVPNYDDDDTFTASELGELLEIKRMIAVNI
jgi:hypothetical protein